MSKVALSSNALGTGTFTIASPNSNTDRTLTLPDNTGTILTTATAGVPVNGPAFSAYPSGNQNITTTTFTKVALQLESFDTAGAFDNSTNYRFTPLIAGYYQVNWVATFLTTAAPAGTFSALFKNGGNIQWTQSSGNSNAYPSMAASRLVYLNGSTDYLELYVYQTSGTTLAVVGSSDYTNFSAFLARSA